MISGFRRLMSSEATSKKFGGVPSRAQKFYSDRCEILGDLIEIMGDI